MTAAAWLLSITVVHSQWPRVSEEDAFVYPCTGHTIESVVCTGTINVCVNKRDRISLLGEQVRTFEFQQ